MNYYPFHVGDYTSHTAHLEPMEDLVYRRMLDKYYLNELPLPTEAAEVARLICLRQSIDEVQTVLKEFFTLDKDGWRHTRCDRELQKMLDKQAKARESAAASVSARRAKMNNENQPNGRTANAERQLSERSTDVELPTPTPTPTPNKIDGLEPQSDSKLIFISIPLVDKTEFSICQSQLQEWVQAYPAVDVEQQLRTMRQWCIANPTKKKTRRGINAFITRWLANKQDTGHAKPATYSQQAFDIARTTVPGSNAPDPALVKIEEDRKRAVPIPDHIRDAMIAIKKKSM